MRAHDLQRQAGQRKVSSRFGISIGIGAALLLAGCHSDTPRLPNDSAPDIVFIIVDDLRPDLGAYGHPIVRTPSIDRLAAAGVRFDRAYAQVPLCNPSRVSLLTGRRPARTGVLDNNIPYLTAIPDVPTLPSHLREAGFFTASIGKVFHGSGRHGRIQRWVDPRSWDLMSFPVGVRKRAGSDTSSVESGSVGAYHWRAASVRDDQLADGRIATAAIEVLAQEREQPLFLAVGFTKPHLPFVAPQRYYGLYPPELIDRFDRQRDGIDLFADSSSPIGRRERLQLTRAYWACVSYVDAQIGRVLEALERRHRTRDTVVVLTSDHGFHLGEHGAWLKGTLYEIATRVPLLVSAPHLKTSGRSSPALVELIDLFPTLIDLAGLETPPDLDGTSLVPLLENPTRRWKGAAFSRLELGPLRGRSVRTDRWRYTEWSRGRRGRELYDHRADPREIVDLGSRPESRSVMRRLRRTLRMRGR